MGFHNCLDLLIQELYKSDSVQIASGVPILGSREIQALRAIVIRLSTFFILPDPLTPIDPIWIER